MAGKSPVSAQDWCIRVLELVLYALLLSAVAAFVRLFMPQSVGQFSLHLNGPEQPPSLVASCLGTQFPCVISDGSSVSGLGWSMVFSIIQALLMLVAVTWLTELARRVPNAALLRGHCSLRLLNMAHRNTPVRVKLATWLRNPAEWRVSLLLLYLVLSSAAGPLLGWGFINFTYPASVSFPMNTTFMGARQSFSPFYGLSVVGVLGQPQPGGWGGFHSLQGMLLQLPPQVSTLCQRVPAGSVQKVSTEGAVVVLGQVSRDNQAALPGLGGTPGLGGLISRMQDGLEQQQGQLKAGDDALMSANTTVYGLHMTTQRSSSLCSDFDECPAAMAAFQDCQTQWPSLFAGDDIRLDVSGANGTMLFARSSGPSMLIQSLAATEGNESFWSIQLVRDSAGGFTPVSITSTNKSFAGSFGLFNLNATQDTWTVESPLTDYPQSSVDGLGVLAAEDLEVLITSAENFNAGVLLNPWLQAVSMCFTVLDASPLPVSATLQAMLELAVFPANISMELQQSTTFTAGVWLMTPLPAVVCSVMAGLAWVYLLVSSLLDLGMHQSECRDFGEAVAVVQCLPDLHGPEECPCRSDGPEMFKRETFWDKELERVGRDDPERHLRVQYTSKSVDGESAGGKA